MQPQSNDRYVNPNPETFRGQWNVGTTNNGYARRTPLSLDSG